MYTLMDFSGDYISALRGCCALKFLHTLESDQGLLAHTRRGTGVSPTKNNRENLKLALKFSVLESITYGIMEVFSLNFIMRPDITARRISSSWNWFCTRTCGAGRPHVWLCHAPLVFVLFRHAFSEYPRPIALKLCHMVGIWLYFIILLQKFGGRSPKKIWGPKTCKISVNFGPLQNLITNISKTAEDIRNRPALQPMAIPPAFNGKGPVNFGPLTAWNFMWVWTH